MQSSLKATHVVVLAIGLSALWWGRAPAMETKKLRALLSASETSGGGNEDLKLTWSLDGEWQRKAERRWNFNLTVDSDYARSETSKLDRLRTAWRFIDKDYGRQRYKFYPVLLVQTEGDHGFDSIHTLAAIGFRQKRRYGFFELTAGASKDLRRAEQWVGDIGFELGYLRKFGNGKWTFRTGPKGEFGALGSVRLRGDRFRYSWDVGLDYAASETIGIGYKLWYGNTVPDSRRTQWLGVQYKWK